MPKKQIAARPLVKRAEVKKVVELKTPERALTAKAALEMGGQAVNGRKQNSGNGAKKRRRQKARQWARHSPDGSNRGLLAVSRNAQNGLEGKRG
jgi:2-C-methyl-D-erythritol 4-phosphate cytidylyltransferase